MKKHLLTGILLLALLSVAATTYTIDQLTNNATPSDGTVIEVYDPSASPKSGKYTLTNKANATPAGITNALGYAPELASAYPFNTPTKLVFVGDSITAGYGVSGDANWPAYLTNTFATYNVVGCSNAAVSGYTITNLSQNYSTYIAPLKPTSGTNGFLFVWAGINDSASSPDYIAGALSNYWTTAKADGWQIVAMTIIPASSVGFTNNQNVLKANALIRQSRVWDYLIDANQLIPSPYGATIDGVHLNTNYHAVIARAALQAISSKAGFNSTAPMHPNGPGSLVDTNGATVFAGQIKTAAGSASSPSIELSPGSATGFYGTGTLIQATIGGVWSWQGGQNSFGIVNDTGGFWAGSSADAWIKRDGAGAWRTADGGSGNGQFKSGKFLVSGTTNQVVFGSTNTAPVSSAAPTKWISVQVSGESTVYRLPLYE